MLNLTSIILLFAFWVSVQAQQWELIDFGQGLNPNDEIIISEHGIKEFVQGELYVLVYNLTGNTITGRGIAKSTDDGQTWAITWLPTNLTTVNNFVINPLSPNEWYISRSVSSNNTSQYIVYKSDDFGQTWTSFGQGLLNPLSNSTITVVELNIDFSNGTLVGLLEEKGSDWVHWHGTERGANDPSWTNSLYFATASAGSWTSGYLKADREEAPNIFRIGDRVKNPNYPLYSRYKIITTNNDTLFVSKISPVDNSDLIYANSGNTIYKNEFGWQGNGNWETVNWSINGVPLNDFEYLWSDGNGFIFFQSEYSININLDDYFWFYSNDFGQSWQPVPIIGLPVISSTNLITSNVNINKYFFYGSLRFNLNLLITDLQENKNKAETFNLSQNYPNPFNPTTSINYFFPAGEKGALTIFNTLGQRIKEFELKESKGNISWDGTNEMGNQVSSGVYFYKLEAGNGFSQTKKMVLMK